jgi:hypothetical protein
MIFMFRINMSNQSKLLLYQESGTFNVSRDVRGDGIFYFKRTNQFHSLLACVR